MAKWEKIPQEKKKPCLKLSFYILKRNFLNAFRLLIKEYKQNTMLSKLQKKDLGEPARSNTAGSDVKSGPEVIKPFHAQLN